MAIEMVKNTGAVFQGASMETAEKAANVEGAGDNGNKISKPQREEVNRKDKRQEKTPEDEKTPEELQTKSPTEALRKAVDEINKRAQSSEAIFGIHDATNRITIKIVDKETKETLKEYPPEKTLDMIAKVWELAGLLVDEKG